MEPERADRTTHTLLSLSLEKNPTSAPTIRYSHRRCRFRSFRAPMRIALSSSCRPVKARCPSPTDGDSPRYALSGAQSTLTLSLVSRVVDGTVSCHCFFFSSSFLRVERARNCSLDSPVALAMDCRTVAQCTGITPGPLCDAGTYARFFCLS